MVEKASPTLTEYLARDKEDQKQHEDLRQEIVIGSQRPIECSSPHCVAVTRRITNESEYILVNTRTGMIVLHLICAGINPNGNLADSSYHRYVGSQLVRRLQ